MKMLEDTEAVYINGKILWVVLMLSSLSLYHCTNTDYSSEGVKASSGCGIYE